MMIPQITSEDILAMDIPGCTSPRFLKDGGQKRVFYCELDGIPYVLKFILINQTCRPTNPSAEETRPLIDSIVERAKREVAIMASVDTYSVVKLGPIGLQHLDYGGQSLILYSEEWIDGKSIQEIIQVNKLLTIKDSIRLTGDVSIAIETIWATGKIHRDIKPGNIMKRTIDDTFVVLDLGIALDLYDLSLTVPGCVVGTPLYLSPEQINGAEKRTLDFRSDLFSLGIVLYEGLTGIHPFIPKIGDSTHLFARIMNYQPVEPRKIRAEIPIELNDIVMRLLQKSPHLRFRDCQRLREQLSIVPIKD